MWKHTFLDIIECTTALASRISKMNLAFGNNECRYTAERSVNGSLLHNRGAGSPWRAIISRVKDATALSKTYNTYIINVRNPTQS